MKTTVFIFIFIFFWKTESANAQSFFREVLLNPALIYPNLASLKKTNDGGYILCGRISDSTSTYGILIRLDSSFNILWHHEYSAPNKAEFRDIIPTQDGGYVVVGDAWDSYQHALLLKTDSVGKILWYKAIGSSNFGNSVGRAIAVLTNGDYVITGEVSGGLSSFHLTCVRPDGYVRWSNAYDKSGSSAIYPLKIIELRSHEILIAGESYSSTTNGVYAAKFDTLGNNKWDTEYEFDNGAKSNSVMQLSNGDLIFAGSVLNLTNRDAFYLRTDSLGVLKHGYRYDTGSKSESFVSMKLMADGNFIFSGPAMIVTDTTGKVLWAKKNHDILVQTPVCIEPMQGSGFLVLSKITFTIPTSDHPMITYRDTNIVQCYDSSVNVIRTSSSYTGSNSYLPSKLYVGTTTNLSLSSFTMGSFNDSLLCSPSVPVLENLPINDITVFPNPVQDKININLPETFDSYEIKVFNLMGELQFSQKFKGSFIKIACQLSSGVYLLQLTSDRIQFVKRIIKE